MKFNERVGKGQQLCLKSNYWHNIAWDYFSSSRVLARALLQSWNILITLRPIKIIQSARTSHKPAVTSSSTVERCQNPRQDYVVSDFIGLLELTRTKNIHSYSDEDRCKFLYTITSRWSYFRIDIQMVPHTSQWCQRISKILFKCANNIMPSWRKKPDCNFLNGKNHWLLEIISSSLNIIKHHLEKLLFNSHYLADYEVEYPPNRLQYAVCK